MKYVRWFHEVGVGDTALVGGKNASLGELVRELKSEGIRVPDGFAITTDAYRRFLKQNKIDERITSILSGLDTQNVAILQKAAKEVRDLIMRAELGSELEKEILDAYAQLAKGQEETLRVAVRSSATAEDLPNASFAGQQESFLNISGERNVLEACKKCYASLFTDRAVSYRHDQGFADEAIALSIGVQRMVRSDLAISGVMFTIDTESGFRDVVLINSSYGLGENIVKGVVVPDEYYVFKPTLHTAQNPIIQTLIGSKESKLIYDESQKSVENVDVATSDRVRLSASSDDILALAKWGCVIEKHYSRKAGRDTPMDIEWAKDGVTGELFVVQARPETVQAQKSHQVLESYHLVEKGHVLVTGRRVGERIGSGPIRVITSARDLQELKAGEILVTDQTDPDWEPAMKKAAGIVTNRGGRTCHAAIVARELGIAAVVGATGATSVLQTGAKATVSCAQGEVGYVYENALKFERSEVKLSELPRPHTKVMLIIGNPDEAFKHSFIPNDGVGLVREEFIFSNRIKIHPMALVNYPKLQDADALKRIAELTAGYDDKPAYLVDQLSQGVAMIAAAFYPNDVIVRFSDFKSNEYAGLIGGREFEPQEENPMIGFRGASRYYDPRFQAAFALECASMKRVREEMGLTNVKLMIPFCRTLEEARRVIAEMKMNGLERGQQGLELYVMCEIPSNVILADGFAELFDGFSIGSNDLTQLVLGVDRDSELVASIFDERNEAVKEMVRRVVKTAQAKGAKIGICGQAPSDYPEFCEFLVSLGIGSIALNPDVAIKTRMIIQNAEDKLGKNK